MTSGVLSNARVIGANASVENRQSCVSIRNLGFAHHDRWLFRGIDLEIACGSFVAIVGPSGVGKTTLLSCLCGLLEPTEGQVMLRSPSEDCFRPPQELRSRSGIIFQQLQLARNLDLLTNVLCGRLAHLSWTRTLFGFPDALRREAFDILSDLDVGRDPWKWVAELSGGEQQRVAVARALFQKPDFHFADEPVSSLDSYYAGRVLGMLRQEARVRGCIVFCVLHQAELIQRFADFALSLNPQDPHAWKLRQVASRPMEGAAS
jgi:phosphonate transport system ATP-binding protein